MANEQINPTFREVVKHPLVYALIILGVAFGFILRSYNNVNEKMIHNCQLEKEQLRKDFTLEIEKLREENRQLRNDIRIMYTEVRKTKEVIDSTTVRIKEQQNELDKK